MATMNTRVGWGAAAIGFALLFLVQMPAALGATLLFALVGVGTGLGMAKWLPRSWYGRQFVAGIRAGAIAGAGAAVGMLLSVLLTAPHDVTALGARSHLLGLHLTDQVHALRGIGWFGVSLVAVALGVALCVVLAGLTAQAFAFDKSRRAIQVIDRAREAAQRSSRSAAMARPTRQLLPTPPPGIVLGQSGDRHGALTGVPVPNPWVGSAQTSPSVPLDLGAAQSRELHEALAAWAASTGAAQIEPPRTQNGTSEEPESPATEQKPGNWLC